jgi:hypothetical protein
MAEASQALANLNGWAPPGPVAEAYLHDWNPINLIMGPVAGGKTWTSCIKALEVARLQHPSTKDGVRKARVVAIRQNYRRAHDTLIPSWQKLFPPDVKALGQWSGVKDGPCEHTISLVDPHYGKIELQMWFRAFGDQDLDSFVRGFEPTAIYINESDELPAHCLGQLYKRCGRFPGPEERPGHLAPAWSGVFGDFNAPDEDSWVYEDVFLDPRPGVVCRVQPSGFSESAENIHNLRKIRDNYYEAMAEQMEPWEIRRFIENRIGFSRVGKPVWPAYREEVHARECRAERGTELIVAMDNGLKFGAAIGQRGQTGALKILDELASPDGEGWSAERAAEELVPLLVNDYAAWIDAGLVRFVVDPAARNRMAARGPGTQDDEAVNWIILFQQKMVELIGICPIELAPTNALGARIGAVERYLTRFDAAGDPALQVNPRCQKIRRAMSGAYRMIKRQGANGEYRTEPDKNHASHIADAVQYLALAAGGATGLARTTGPGREISAVERAGGQVRPSRSQGGRNHIPL